MNAKTYGGELSATYDASERLRFTIGYSFLNKGLTPDRPHVDLFNGAVEGNDPKHQFMLRTSADLGRKLEWDSTLRFVSRLPAPVVPRYWELDARLGWIAKETMEFSIVGANLLHPQHGEFGASPGREEVQRNVYGRVALRF